MIIFQFKHKEEEKKEKQVPKPTEIAQREKALNFLDNLLHKIDKNPSDAVALIEQAPSFQVTLSRKVFEKLKDAFSTEYETGFLLFADPKTHVIVEATEESSLRRAHSISFDWEATKMIIADMKANGLELVGEYHSHPGESNKWKGHPDYDHSALSADDKFLSTIPGTSINIRENDPDYQKIVKNWRISLLGSIVDGEFIVRAFVPLTRYAILGSPPMETESFEYEFPYTHAGRKITREIYEDFGNVLEFKGLRNTFVKHYDEELKLIEFKLDVK